MLKPATLFSVLALAAGGAFATEHPALVSLATTDCADCHDDLVEGRGWVHAATEDCTTCHDMTIGDDGTNVELTESEPELCLLCHDELTAAVEVELETPHFPVTESCLNCHDPHGTDQPGPLNAPMVELCRDCHDFDDLQGVHGNQLSSESDCTFCHDPHGSNYDRMLLGRHQHPPFAEGSCDACHRPPFGGRIRLRARGERLCSACHGDVADGAKGSVHPALVGDGRAPGCLSCHNPHMSDRSSLLIADGPAVCAGCHAEVSEAAESDGGHPPAADDCLTCHLPHGSDERRLLSTAADELCTDCHDADDEDLTAVHLGADLARLDCVACHSPHGSRHASLLAENLHEAIEAGCDICHLGAFDELEEDGGSELCLFCHDDLGETIASATVPHAALEFGACIDCHNPHASPQEHLVKAPGAGPCADCHDDQVPASGETAHGVIDLVGCRACHEPHGGAREKLLRDEPTRLCLSCHASSPAPGPEAGTALLLGRFEVSSDDARAIVKLNLSADGEHNHPVTGHRVLGPPSEERLIRVKTDFEGEFTCLTCHDPHKGRSSALLRWNAATSDEACAACHAK